MPRTARASRGGVCYHVVTRGNARATVFHDRTDYERFLRLLARARARVEVELLGYVLMPNHIHLVCRPLRDGDLGVWMHWLLTTHTARHRIRHGTVGRIWQGRFKAFPVQTDRYLLALLRYVERNPVAAGLVGSAADWPWSSLPARLGRAVDRLTTPSPVPVPDGWLAWVDTPLADCEVESVRKCIARGRPFGDESWVRSTADRFGLLSSLRARGRPRRASARGAPLSISSPTPDA